MRAYLFPGQGAQHKGMGADLFDEFPQMVAAADRILGYSVQKLCLEDPNSELGQTQFTQPMVYLIDALKLEQLKEQGHQTPDMVAGHSLGEYAALLAAEAYDFETGLVLVQKRAEAMAKIRNGGMAAVLGCTAQEVEAMLVTAGCDRLKLANRNTLLQNIVSGPKDELLRFETAVQEAGKSYIPLPVSGAFHSVEMKPAQEEFTEALRSIEFNWLRTPVISNVEAVPHSQSKIKIMLSLQITESVRWYETILYMKSMGVQEFVEVGPGNLLTNMLRKIQTETAAAAADKMLV